MDRRRVIAVLWWPLVVRGQGSCLEVCQVDLRPGLGPGHREPIEGK